MEYSINEKIARLYDEVSNIKVIRAIGQTGDINFAPKAGEVDIVTFRFEY